MKNQTYVDCLLLIGSAVSLNIPVLQEVLTTVVTLSLTIEEIIIDDSNLMLNVILLLNENWLDPRLGATVETRTKAVEGKIWDPKITNIYGEQYNENLEDTVFWRGYTDGDIVRNKKIKLRNYCTKFLQDFPFDTQICEVKFGSYRFSEEEVLIKWKDVDPVIVLNDIKSNEFYLKNVSAKVVVDNKPTGNFSRGLIQFTIKRDPKHYLICIGIPCSIVVTLNYLSIWIKSKRTRINLLSVFVHIFYYHLSVCRTKVAYFKHLDILIGLSTLISVLMLVQSLVLEEIDRNTVWRNQPIVKKYFNESWTSLLTKIAYPFLYFIIMLTNYCYL